MNDRRMFSRGIITADKFTDLPATAQLVYIRACLEADDEGFIPSIRAVGRFVGASAGDVDILKESGYIIVFPSGVTCITDWRIHNTNLRADRITPSIFPEKELVAILPTGRYTLTDPDDGTRDQKEVKKSKKDQNGENAAQEKRREDKIREEKMCCYARARERDGADYSDSLSKNDEGDANKDETSFVDIVKSFDTSGIAPDLLAALMKQAETLDAEPAPKASAEVIDLYLEEYKKTPLLDRQTDGLIFGRKALGDETDYESNRETLKELTRLYGSREVLKAVEIALEAGHAGEIGYIKGVLRRRSA